MRRPDPTYALSSESEHDAGEAACTAYEDAPWRFFHFQVCIASTGGVFADGFGLGIIGIALQLAGPELHLSAVWVGLLAGASLAGLFGGALLTGPAADHFGRRPIFAHNMVLAALLSALQFTVHSAMQWLLLRLVIGFLLGTDYVVSKALLIEFIPRRLRGRILGALSVAWSGGYACAYATGFALSALGTQSWRWMLLASAAPCLLIAPLRLRIPESPLWLCSHGHLERAARVIQTALGGGIRLPMNAAAYIVRRGRWSQLFSIRWRRRTLVACTFFTSQVIPYFAVGTFISQVLSALRLKGPYAGGLIYNLSLVLGAIAGLLIVDRLSRRSFLVGSFATAAVTMFVLSVSWSLTPAVTILLFAIFAGVLSAATNLVYVYLPELFPTDLRASGVGLAIAASRIGSAASTFMLPVVVASYGVRTALGACVAILVVGALVCWRWAPETKNIRLSALDEATSNASG